MSRELRRILRPGGLLFLTPHGGETSVRHAFGEARSDILQFRCSGFATVGEAEGTNDSAAFHTVAGPRRHLKGFRLRTLCPNGRLHGHFEPFQPAAMQNVAVFERIDSATQR